MAPRVDFWLVWPFRRSVISLMGKTARQSLSETLLAALSYVMVVQPNKQNRTLSFASRIRLYKV